MSAFRGFWNSSGQTGDIGGSGPVDMTVTGEGCQPITDLGWKKKENKYLGQSSLSEREVKDLKDMSKQRSIEQFNYKFPDNEKHLGLENVSYHLTILLLEKHTYFLILNFQKCENCYY